MTNQMYIMWKTQLVHPCVVFKQEFEANTPSLRGFIFKNIDSHKSYMRHNLIRNKTNIKYTSAFERRCWENSSGEDERKEAETMAMMLLQMGWRDTLAGECREHCCLSRGAMGVQNSRLEPSSCVKSFHKPQRKHLWLPREGRRGDLRVKHKS